MKEWIILHTHSEFSQQLIKVLRDKVVMTIDVKHLVANTGITARYHQDEQHAWIEGDQVVESFRGKIIYQEVFYHFDQALGVYYPKDRAYVRHSWQAYLLGLFSHAHRVINPIDPRQLSISQYQFPRLNQLAKDIGMKVPYYTIGSSISGGLNYDGLWVSPSAKQLGATVLSVEDINSDWLIVRFVRYDPSFIVTWPELPDKLTVQLCHMARLLGIHVGEVYFKYHTDWVFYGMYPHLRSSGASPDVFIEIAECLRDIGKEEISYG